MEPSQSTTHSEPSGKQEEATGKPGGESRRPSDNRADELAFGDPARSPQVQDIIMSGVIGCVAVEIAGMLGISPTDALMEFYESDTCRRLHDKSTGLYLFGEKYIAEEFVANRTNRTKV